MMKKIVLATVAVLLAFQQVLGATDQEVEDAYSDFENATYAVFEETEAVRQNYTNNFLENVALIRLDGKLAMNKKIEETNQLIQKLAARTDGYENIDVTECTQGMDTILQTYVDDALDRMDDCLYNWRYNTGFNVMSARWTDIVHLGMDYLTCTQKAMEDCKGDEACNDQIITEIAQKKEEATYTLNLFAVDMYNSLDSVPVNCKDRILMDVFSYSSDIVEYVSTCMDRVISSFVPLMCTVSKK
jgi:hypothetical protein